jgi:amino acid adenylation domain-containing protein
MSTAADVVGVKQPRASFSVTADLVLTSDDADQSVRWTPGERLHHLVEQRCDRFRADRDGDHPAVAGSSPAITYDELDARANRMARFLIGRGVVPGDRVGLLLDEPVAAYVGMLATLKVNAAYVPLDPGAPPDRLAYILRDARVGSVLTRAPRRGLLALTGAEALCVDEARELIDGLESGRLRPAEQGRPLDDLATVLYGADRTGRPTGVAINHAGLCNVVRVAAEVYGLRPGDRMYQGTAIVARGAVEEIWVPLVVGATLVPGPAGNPVGAELAQFLRAERISALRCEPSLLATMDDTLPGLRFLLVSGPACPPELVARWHRPGRRFLNVYGPPEVTFGATWTTLHPDRRVTAGVPLRTNSVMILAAHEQRLLPPGELGEIGVAGICLSSGYLNRDDLTARAFVPDFVGIPNNTSGRIYRTGDLGRITPDGLVQRLARIEARGLVRGHRIEPFVGPAGSSRAMVRAPAAPPTPAVLPTGALPPTATPPPTTAAPPTAASPPAVAPGGGPRPARRASTGQLLLVGMVQAGVGVAGAFLVALAIELGYSWLAGAIGLLDGYLRAVGFGGAVFVALAALPVAAKWLLIGRWRPAEIPIWSLHYVRFWMVRTLLRISPLARFGGSPLYVLYLRALGATIGKGVTVFTGSIPVCTDLLGIGDGAVVRRGAVLPGYRAEAGWIRTGRISIGADAIVGEASVLDIDTGLGDSAQLGHASALHAGATVPAGRRYHGCPAEEARTDFAGVEPRACGTRRRFGYGLLQRWRPCSGPRRC